MFRAALLVIATALSSPAHASAPYPQDVSLSLNLETFDQVWTTVRDEHYDPDLGGIDWNAVREELRPRAGEARSQGELRGVLNRMLQRLGQSHLAVMPGIAAPARAEKDVLVHPRDQTWDSGSGYAVHLDDGLARVASVVPGSIVARAGVQPGWRIARVGETLIPTSCRTTGAANFPLLRATGEALELEFIDPAGTPVRVEVPLGKRRSREYHFEGMQPIEVSIEHELIEPDIGYIAFNWFFDPVMVMGQFHAAMDSLRGSAGIVIDIRGNNGGMGTMAADMVAWFGGDDDAYLGTMIMREAEVQSFVPGRARKFRGPVAVLIDGASGSAAEIFAAGMRDVGGARIFGQTTAGAVLPASFERLPNGDSLLYVIANYVTVGGKTLEGKGVVPDRTTSIKRGDDPFEDEALQSAIDWILGNE